MKKTLRLLFDLGLIVGVIALNKPYFQSAFERAKEHISAMFSDPPIAALMPAGTLTAEQEEYCNSCGTDEERNAQQAIAESAADLLGGDVDALGVTVKAKVPADETITVFNRKAVKNDASREFTFADRCIVRKNGRILGGHVPTTGVIAFAYIPPLTKPTSGDECPRGVVSIMSTRCLLRWKDETACVDAGRSSDEHLGWPVSWISQHPASLLLWQQTTGADLPDELREKDNDVEFDGIAP